MDEDFFEEDENEDYAMPIDDSLNRSIPTLPHIGGTPYKLGGVPVQGGIVTKRKDSYIPTDRTALGEEV